MSAKNLTLELQNYLVDATASFCNMRYESTDIVNMYWKTDVTTVLAALTDGDCVGVNARITKANMTAGLTLAENIVKFFTNQAISQADYNATCQLLKYGNGTLDTPRSVATESLADRMKQLGTDVLTMHQTSMFLISYYNENEIADLCGVLEDERIVFGSDMTKSDLCAVMALLTQFINFVDNATVTTGNYIATLQKWKRFA